MGRERQYVGGSLSKYSFDSVGKMTSITMPVSRAIAEGTVSSLNLISALMTGAVESRRVYQTSCINGCDARFSNLLIIQAE